MKCPYIPIERWDFHRRLFDFYEIVLDYDHEHEDNFSEYDALIATLHRGLGENVVHTIWAVPLRGAFIIVNYDPDDDTVHLLDPSGFVRERGGNWTYLSLQL